MVNKLTLIAGGAMLAVFSNAQPVQAFQTEWTAGRALFNVNALCSPRPGGGVYVAVGQGTSRTVTAVTSTGERLWTRSVPGLSLLDVDTASNGDFLVFDYDGDNGRVTRYSPTGATVWTTPTFPASYNSDLVALPDGRTAVAANFDTGHNVFVLNTSGTRDWTRTVNGAWSLQVEADSSGRLYVQSVAGFEQWTGVVRRYLGSGAEAGAYLTPDFSTTFMSQVMHVTDEGSVLLASSAEGSAEFVKLSPTLARVHGAEIPMQGRGVFADIQMTQRGVIYLLANETVSGVSRDQFFVGTFWDPILQRRGSAPTISRSHRFAVMPHGDLYTLGGDGIGDVATWRLRRWNAGAQLMSSMFLGFGNALQGAGLTPISQGDIYTHLESLSTGEPTQVTAKYQLTPVISNDFYDGVQNSPLVVPAVNGLFRNDFYAAGGVVVLGTSPSNGNVTFNADGSFTYTPTANFAGTDSFTYRVQRGGLSNAATVTLRIAASIASLDLPAEVGNANPNIPGRVTLSGVSTASTTVRLSYTGPVGGPSTVVIPAGQRTANFSMFATRVLSPTSARVQASVGQNFLNRELTVRPAAFRSFGVTPMAYSGTSVEWQVKLDGLVATDTPVRFTTSHPTVLPNQRVETIPANAMDWGGTLEVGSVNGDTLVTMVATINGVSRSAVVQVRTPRVSGLVLGHLSLRGGGTTTLLVKVFGVAPTGGLNLAIRSNSSAVSVPATVTIPEGDNSITVSVRTTAVGRSIPVLLSVTAGGQTNSVSLTVLP